MPRLDAIGIVVSDVAAAVRFYRLLDLDFPEDAAAQDHVEAITPSGIRVMLDTEVLIKQLNPGWVRPSTNSVGLAFLCDSPADVDATYRSLIDAGHRGKTEPWDAFWGQRYAQVVDPDGSVVDLFARL